MVELVLDGAFVTQSSSQSVEDHTVRCVVGSEPISGDYLVHSGGIMKDTTIDSAYVDGLVLMYGNSRQHIWTLANGAWENDTRNQEWNCPCDTNGVISVPPFVGEDYFCESGYVYPGYRNTTDWYRLHSSDPLWDGKGCHSTSPCCSLHNPPYFTKSLDQTTTDDFELRMCLRDPSSYNNIAVELVELYVK